MAWTVWKIGDDGVRRLHVQYRDPKTRKRKSKGFGAIVTDAEAEVLRLDVERRMERKPAPRIRSEPAAALDRYLLARTAARRSADTLAYYRGKLEPFFAFMGAKPLHAWTGEDVRRHVATRAEAWNAHSVVKFLAALDSFVTWCRDTAEPAIDVCDLTGKVERPEVEAHESQAWTAEEATSICREARTPTKGATDVLDVPVHLNLHAAMPKGDIVTITWEEIDRSGKQWVIRGVRHKRRSVKREIPVNDELRAALERHPGFTGLVCPDLPKDAGTLSQMHSRLLKRAGLAEDRRSGGWHRGKHTCLTLLGANGADLPTLRRYACHSPNSMMVAKYLHTDRVRMNEAAATIGRLLAPAVEAAPVSAASGVA